MDPNETLACLRVWLRSSREATDKADAYDALANARDHAEALDEWLSRGGFLPDAWDHSACQADDRASKLAPGQTDVIQGHESDVRPGECGYQVAYGLPWSEYCIAPAGHDPEHKPL